MENPLGIRLKKARKKLGMTLTEVANATGYSPAYICRIEGGTRQNINYKLYAELVKLYGIEGKVGISDNQERDKQDLKKLMIEVIKKNEKIAEVQLALLKLNEDLSDLMSYDRENIDLYRL